MMKTLYVKEIDPLEHKVNALKWCESSGKEKAVVYNDGGKGRTSYGLWQFQQRTFDYLGERYGLPHSNIHDMGQQRAIVREALNRGENRHWYNCSKKLGWSVK